jgi:hypothetical protein
MKQLRWYIKKFYDAIFDQWSIYGRVTKLDFQPEKITVSFSNTSGTKNVAYLKGTLIEVMYYMQDRFGLERWRQLVQHDDLPLLKLMDQDRD